MFKQRHTYYILFALLFAYLFLVFDTNFHGPDEPIYFGYIESIVEDKDLNAVNHLDERYPYYLPSGKIGVSSTLNLPDFHNHGGIVLWVPFYLYGKAAGKGRQPEGLRHFTRGSLSLSTAVFSLYTLALSFFICAIFYPVAASFWATLVLFFGTPFYYFSIIEVGNANIIGSLFSALSILLASYALGRGRQACFLYGLFFAMCVIVKTELLFQLVFITLLFLMLLRLGRAKWPDLAMFAAGCAPGLLLRGVNEYLKYGTLHIGEASHFGFKSFYLWEQLFSSYHGFIYTSPVFFICIIGGVLSAVALARSGSRAGEQGLREAYLLALAAYLAVKIFMLSFRYAWGGGTPGARILLTEFPIFALLFLRAFQRRRRLLVAALIGLTLVSVAWNLMVIGEYVSKMDMEFLKCPPGIFARLEGLKDVWQDIAQVRDLGFKAVFLLPLACLCFSPCLYLLRYSGSVAPSFWYAAGCNKGTAFYLFLGFVIYLYVFYTAATAFNLGNNRKNVEKMQAAGFFEKTEVVDRRGFERQEHVGSLNEMITFYSLTNRQEKARRIEKLKQELYNE